MNRWTAVCISREKGADRLTGEVWSAVWDSSTRKEILYSIINSVKPKEKTFRVDELLESHDYFVVRLSLYVLELSLADLAWAKLEHHVRSRSTSGDKSMKQDSL
jgi:hypothetical protein